MTMTWNTGTLRIARPERSATSEVAERFGEDYASNLDMDIDINNDDTVVIGRPSKSVSRLTSSAQEKSQPPPMRDGLAMLQRLFTESSYRELQQIEITRRGESICLSGRLPSFFLKQTAQEIVRQQDAQQRIVNSIEVVS